MLSKSFFNWKGLLLWSNHFYGLCSILLSIESSVILTGSFPSFLILALIYLSTVAYYSYAYLRETKSGIYDDRSKWYYHNKKYLIVRQGILVMAVLYIAILKLDGIKLFFSQSASIQFVLLFSCLLSVFYYLPNYNSRKLQSIRKWGISKSISIAWVWTVTCCLLPILLATKIDNHNIAGITHSTLYLFQLFVFILLLAILFDIKYLARDKEELVNTIVLKYGVKYTIQKFATPLIGIYIFISGVIYYLYQQSIGYLLSHILLIVILYFVMTAITKIKSIHYNILLIDGLMIVKALLGIGYAL